MPFVVSKEMSRSFETEGKLIVEDLLSPPSFETLRQTIVQAIHNGFKSSYLSGRDLFRSQQAIKKIILRKNFQKMVIDLCREPRLLFAFDQILDCRKERATLFEHPASLQEIMSVDPLRMGLLLVLEGDGIHPLFPNKPNNALFFNPWIVIDWREIPLGQLSLLFGFAAFGAVYKENSIDPNTHLLKRLDYQHNQPLKTKTHPLIKGY